MCVFHVSLGDQIFSQQAAHFLLHGYSRTLQPHLFHFTACGVKAGQEALLDYGEVSTHTSLAIHLVRACTDNLVLLIFTICYFYWRALKIAVADFAQGRC